ncbi:MAG: carbon-nitrogen hydrolase [Candidatus Velthaea sp.]
MYDVAIVQFKPRKGDVAANMAALREVFAQLAADRPPKLIVLPEAALTGYFLEGAVYDLAVTREACAASLNHAWQASGGAGMVDVVCGFYENDGGQFYNSAIYATLGGAEPAIVHVHRKMFLPSYGVFDEERFHSRGRKLGVFQSGFGTAAIMICEDAWHAIMPTVAALKGAKLLIVPSASPGRGIGGTGELESVGYWRSLLQSHASEHGVYVLYAGLTGFEGGKGMSGSSCAISPRGETLVAAPALDACILRVTLDPAEIDVARATLPLLGSLTSVLPDLWFDDELPLPKRRTAEAD